MFRLDPLSGDMVGQLEWLEELDTGIIILAILTFIGATAVTSGMDSNDQGVLFRVWVIV